MLLLGCKPKERNTEQHDVFFGIGEKLSDLIPSINNFWPEGKQNLHIDAWREVTSVDEFAITVTMKTSAVPVSQTGSAKLFFINLGGYRKNEFEEFHYKMLVAGVDKSIAIKNSKQTAFFKHTGFKGAESHIDDKYGIDVDDIYEIPDILDESAKEQFQIIVSPGATQSDDELHLGYFRLDRL